MKVLFGLLMFIVLGAGAYGQNAPAKFATEIMAHSESTVKGLPFSADAISESVQMLADGNRITRSSTSKLYRNSEGRFRREGTGGSGGFLGSHFEMHPSISIIDPVGGFRYLLNPDNKTARSTVFKGAPEAIVMERYKAVTVDAEKLRAKLKAAQAADSGSGRIRELHELADIDRLVTATAATPPTPPTPAAALAGFAYSDFSANTGNSRTEQLGTQTIEGVEAEGTRRITTIEAGKIGNERPIEIVYERWYSKDLQLVVMSRHSDPRSGEQTYRLTNINRTEPDPSLFSLPSGYNLLNEPSGIHRTIVKGEGHNVYTTKAPAVTHVKATKP